MVDCAQTQVHDRACRARASSIARTSAAGCQAAPEYFDRDDLCGRRFLPDRGGYRGAVSQTIDKVGVEGSVVTDRDPLRDAADMRVLGVHAAVDHCDADAFPAATGEIHGSTKSCFPATDCSPAPSHPPTWRSVVSPLATNQRHSGRLPIRCSAKALAGKRSLTRIASRTRRPAPATRRRAVLDDAAIGARARGRLPRPARADA